LGASEKGRKKTGVGVFVLTETITDHKKQDSYRFVNQKGIKIPVQQYRNGFAKGDTKQPMYREGISFLTQVQNGR
jgi:hypothetical protein